MLDHMEQEKMSCPTPLAAATSSYICWRHPSQKGASGRGDSLMLSDSLTRMTVACFVLTSGRRIGGTARTELDVLDELLEDDGDDGGLLSLFFLFFFTLAASARFGNSAAKVSALGLKLFCVVASVFAAGCGGALFGANALTLEDLASARSICLRMRRLISRSLRPARSSSQTSSFLFDGG